MANPKKSGRSAWARRGVLASALAARGVGEEKPDAPPRRAKGPKIFLDYDQSELDAAYNQAAYAANRDQLLARYASNSELVRERIGAPERVAYGPTEIEKLDLYRTKHKHAPIMMFIHGGAWRAGSAKNYAFAAEMFVTAGAHCVVPDFIAVQDAAGSLAPMAEQVRRAIGWVHRHAPSFDGNARQLYLAGHSSGAHLAACALVTDWCREFALPRDLIKGAVLASGIYDLNGPRLSARNTYVAFDDEIEHALSPQRHIGRLWAPLVIGYASLDTPEFQRQSRDFAVAVKAAAKPVELIRGENYNHFEFIETLANPFGLLGRAALRQMGLAKG
jgi:arylformamidase